ncbi:MAG: YihY/virulence factor BrkB family protein [Candidatus Sumerlaeia bacterium]|nr:YihY/virulence factor BrkB family protein [Candidatus Sumerlaeia bacterium]
MARTSPLQKLRVDRQEELRLRGQPWYMAAARFLIVLGRQVGLNLLPQRAGSLTYTTILSLFPLFLLLLASASFFFTPDRQDELVDQVQTFLYPREQVIAVGPGEAVDQAAVEENMAKLRSFVRDSSESFRSKAAGLGVAGFVAMLAAAYGLYNAVEGAMDATWRGAGARSFKRTFSTFATLLLVAPVAIGLSLTFTGVASGAKAYLAKQEQAAAAPEAGAGAVAALRDTTWRTVAVVLDKVDFVVPVLLNGLFFAMAYFFIPTARVRWGAAFAGGLFAGLLWEVSKAGFATYVFSSALNREIFASLGAIPIFLIWIYFSWAIFLLGNEFAYVAQHFYALAADHFLKRPVVPYDARLLVAALLAVHREFGAGRGAASGSAIARMLRLRRGEVDGLFAELVRTGYIAQLSGDRLLPEIPPEKVMIADVIRLGEASSSIAALEEKAGEIVLPALRSLERRLAIAIPDGETLADLMRSPALEGEVHGSA